MTLPAYTGALTPAHRQLITSIRDSGRPPWSTALAVLGVAAVMGREATRMRSTQRRSQKRSV